MEQQHDERAISPASTFHMSTACKSRECSKHMHMSSVRGRRWGTWKKGGGGRVSSTVESIPSCRTSKPRPRNQQPSPPRKSQASNVKIVPSRAAHLSRNSNPAKPRFPKDFDISMPMQLCNEVQTATMALHHLSCPSPHCNPVAREIERGSVRTASWRNE